MNHCSVGSIGFRIKIDQNCNGTTHNIITLEKLEPVNIWEIPVCTFLREGLMATHHTHLLNMKPELTAS